MAQSIEKRMITLRNELQNLTKDELIERIITLEKHTNQLRNVIKKSSNAETSQRRQKNGRNFDYSKMVKRHILLRFYYLGWDYQGFTIQEDTIETIEHYIFEALKRTCLIQDRETSNYHRCGRTDKGVSAFHQVISIDVRSKLTTEEVADNSEENLKKEIEYCSILNRVLPSEIRCVAWMPLNNPLYSARFDCKQRTYRYFFPKGDLSLELLMQGAQHLLGSHDFRNLCKMDVNNGVTTFIRHINSVQVFPVTESAIESGYKMYYLEIRSQAFLWHQIRCIVAVLFLVGQGLEKPDIVKELLDVEKNPCKPNFQMANYIPLNLFDCEFRDKGVTSPENAREESIDLTSWIYDEQNLKFIIQTLQGQWTTQSVKSAMINSMLHDLELIYDARFSKEEILSAQIEVLKDEKRGKVHKPLLDRQKCQSLEERMVHFETKKRKIGP